MRRLPIFIASLACGMAAFAVAPAPPATAQDIEAGAALFRGKGNCFACHGPTARGTPLAPDLTDDQWVNFAQPPSREEVESLIRSGVPSPVRHPAPMPPMGGARLSREEVTHLAAYVLSLATTHDDGPATEPAAPALPDPAGASAAVRPPRGACRPGTHHRMLIRSGHGRPCEGFRARCAAHPARGRDSGL